MPSQISANQWIKLLRLKAHPEGGYFRETYRSSQKIKSKRGVRPAGTAIYFLLKGREVSNFHRLLADEIWHFYAGTALEIVEIISKTKLKRTRLGNHPEKGEALQYQVEAGKWFAAYVLKAESYALAGCTVAPGFEFEDFELAERKKLLKEFPKHRRMILRLTRES